MVREITLNAPSLASRVNKSLWSPLARNPPSSEPLALNGSPATTGSDSTAE
jgi:hypothetical protein